MKKRINIILFFISIFTFSYAQEINHQVEFDLDFDGNKEKIIFIDEYAKEFEEYQFSKILIINGSDSLFIDNDEIWIPKDSLYKNADYNISNRIGLIKQNKKIYLWLTGFEYGCCINKTAVYEYSKTQIKVAFLANFEFQKIECFNGERYFIGTQSLFECLYLGMRQTGFNIFGSAKKPKTFLSIVNDFEINDSLMLEQLKKTYDFLEPNLSLNDNYLLVETSQNRKRILISSEYGETLKNRDYGIASLVKLNPEFLKKYNALELRKMRNELFAIYGYNFKSNDLKVYFKTKDWYNPKTNNLSEITEYQSEIEKYNIKLILQIENNAR